MAASPYENEAIFRQMLEKAVSAGASDIHFKVGQPPGARIKGDMVYFRASRITPADAEAVARHLLSGDARPPGARTRSVSTTRRTRSPASVAFASTCTGSEARFAVGAPGHPRADPHARRAGGRAGLSRAVGEEQGTRAGRRSGGQRKELDPGGDDRAPELERGAAHRHHRRPHRVPARGRQELGEPARGRASTRPPSRRRSARRCARIPT